MLLLPSLAHLLEGKVTSKLATARERKKQELDSISMVSGRSFITAMDSAVEKDPSGQSLIITLQVPLNYADENQLEDL